VQGPEFKDSESEVHSPSYEQRSKRELVDAGVLLARGEESGKEI
jgi:hypothetical protein